MPVRRRLLHPIWLIAALPGYVGWRLLPALGVGPDGVLAGVALLIAACIPIRWAVRVRSLQHQRFADRMAWVGFIAMGFFS
jgi:hypothetical protein